jgi:hypothetical protein
VIPILRIEDRHFALTPDEVQTIIGVGMPVHLTHSAGMNGEERDRNRLRFLEITAVGDPHLSALRLARGSDLVPAGTWIAAWGIPPRRLPAAGGFDRTRHLSLEELEIMDRDLAEDPVLSRAGGRLGCPQGHRISSYRTGYCRRRQCHTPASHLATVDKDLALAVDAAGDWRMAIGLT